MRSKALFIGIAAAFVFAVAADGSVPHQMNYQGYVTDAGGNPITGTLEMTFSIWDAETGGVQLWSETQSSVSVTNGTCSVILGSVTSIPDDVFTGPSRWLETQIGTEVLSPRREMVSLGYAFKAEYADTADYARNPDGHSLDAADGDPVDAVLVDDDGNVGIGATNPSAKLDVRGTLQVGIDGTGYDVNFYGGASGGRLFWDASKRAFRAGRAFGTQWDDTNVGITSTAMGVNTTARGIASTAMGSGATANNHYSTAMGSGTTANGSISTAMGFNTTARSYASVAMGRYNAGGGSANSWVDTDPLFEIGIGTASDPAYRANALTVFKNGTMQVGANGTGYDVNFYGADNGGRLFWDASKMAFRAGIATGSQWNDPNVGIYSTAMGYNTEAGGEYSTAMGVNTEASGEYSTAMGYSTEASGDRATAMGWGPTADGKASTAMGYNTTAGSFASVAIGRYNMGGGSPTSWSSGDPLFEIGIGTGSDPADRANALTVRKNGNVEVKGRIITSVLEITGGADLSEQFEIRGIGADLLLSPGMVVSIDPDRPGDLVVSDRAYDRRVAGIISGAGGVKPGVLMGQSGSEADGGNPVALTGRVYCLADASDTPIEPGDLLTTSDAPGHAMKVTDYAMAQGAIIGKAMSSLEDGKGLVLVLVTLQ